MLPLRFLSASVCLHPALSPLHVPVSAPLAAHGQTVSCLLPDRALSARTGVSLAPTDGAPGRRASTPAVRCASLTSHPLTPPPVTAWHGTTGERCRDAVGHHTAQGLPMRRVPPREDVGVRTSRKVYTFWPRQISRFDEDLVTILSRGSQDVSLPGMVHGRRRLGVRVSPPPCIPRSALAWCLSRGGASPGAHVPAAAVLVASDARAIRPCDPGRRRSHRGLTPPGRGLTRQVPRGGRP